MAYLCHLGFDFNMEEALKATIVALYIPNKYAFKSFFSNLSGGSCIFRSVPSEFSLQSTDKIGPFQRWQGEHFFVKVHLHNGFIKNLFCNTKNTFGPYLSCALKMRQKIFPRFSFFDLILIFVLVHQIFSRNHNYRTCYHLLANAFQQIDSTLSR